MENKCMLSLQEQAHSVFEHYNYELDGIKPSSYFWKELAKGKQSPAILIPDTLILNDQNSLLWVYSDERGRVNSTTNVSLKDFVHKTTAFCSPNELCCTIKRLTCKDGLNNFGVDLKLVNSRYMHNMSVSQLGDGVIVIQKYVKSHGDRAFFCRTVYQSAASSHCFLITNKVTYDDSQAQQLRKFTVTADRNGQFRSRAHIVRSSTGKHLQETLPYMKEIVRYFREQRGITMSEMVGDFVKDQEGNWWLVGIKAFKILGRIARLKKVDQEQSVSRLTDKERYQKTKECGYCQKYYLQSELTHKMTRRMLMEVDSYLLHMGKNFKWLTRNDAVVDPHSLYQQFRVCSRCYRLYIEIQGLLGFQGTFLKKIGMGAESNPKEVLLRLTSKEQLQAQSKDKEIYQLRSQIPQQIALGPNSSIITKDGYPVRNDQTINEMVRYRFLIYLHELDQLSGVKPHHNYHLQFAAFHTKFRVKLDLNPKSTVVTIKKLRLCYFFLQSGKQHAALSQYLAQLDTFTVTLVQESRVNGEKKNIGCLSLDAKEFISGGKKSFYKFLDLGWGLEGCIGLARSPNCVNTSRLILSTPDKFIYIPNQQYYLCQALPEEWMYEIENKNKNKATATDALVMTSLCVKNEETADRFIPERPSQLPLAKPKMDWQAQLKKELKAYERRK